LATSAFAFGAMVVAELNIAAFEKRSGRGQWPLIPRQVVADGLRDRVILPALINQGGTQMCGPAAFLYCVARSYPEAYVNYIIDLYDSASAKLWGFSIDASRSVRDSSVPLGPGIDPVDWIGLASLRESENLVHTYDGLSDGAAGATLPATLASWFKKATYSSVHNVTNLVGNKAQADIEAAGHFQLQGYDVCLFISSKMLRGLDAFFGATVPSHWVVLASPIKIVQANIDLTVYSWGSDGYRVPQRGQLPVESFVGNFWGYVAAR
jgi:hypothetical protein